MRLKTKERLKTLAVVVAILSLVSIASEMDYQDAVAQHAVNCSSSTYTYDNKGECE